MTLIARNIEVVRGGTTILQGVSFRAEPGHLIGVLGPSGAGKSTLLYALAGFRPPNEGTILLGAESLLEKFEELKSRIGFVPQDDIVPTALKVGRVLQYAADLRLPELTPEERESRVQATLRQLGLAEREKLRVSKLSGGQRKRVSVGVELLSQPDYLFADEPTSGLDPALERTLTETLRSLCSEQDKTIVVTTHIMTSLDLLDRVCVLASGRLVYFGPPGELKKYFGVDDYVEIYAKLDKKAAPEWAAAFRKSPLWSEYL